MHILEQQTNKHLTIKMLHTYINLKNAISQCIAVKYKTYINFTVDAIARLQFVRRRSESSKIRS